MTQTNKFEEQLDDLFVKNAPKLPEGGRQALVAWAPIVSLVLGILSLATAWGLWHWAHIADSITNYANQFCGAYGNYSGYSCSVTASRFSVWLWLGVASMVVDGVLYLLAYPGLKDRTKAGWNYLYYALWLQVAYAVLSLLIPYNTSGHFISFLIGSAIGFYLLFQIRSNYLGRKHDHQAPTPSDHKD